MLDDDADEALQRPEDGAVDHHRAVLGVVGADVLELEPLRHRVVDLHGAELPRAADRVRDLVLQLRTVERSLAGVDVVVEAVPLQRVLERRLGGVPDRVAAEAFFGTGGEGDADVGEAEDVVHLRDQVQLAVDLRLHLLRHDEQVRVVLREGADAHQPRGHAAALVAVQAGEVGQADRKVAVGAALHRINLRVAGAVHRFEAVLLLLDLDEVHVLLVVFVVPADLEQLCVPHQRRDHLAVALAAVVAAHELE